MAITGISLYGDRSTRNDVEPQFVVERAVHPGVDHWYAEAIACREHVQWRCTVRVHDNFQAGHCCGEQHRIACRCHNGYAVDHRSQRSSECLPTARVRGDARLP